MLLTRPHWLIPGAPPRLGVGLGQSVIPDPDDSRYMPFWGIYAADKSIYSSLRETLQSTTKRWADWVWWAYLDLRPPEDHGDLLAYYASAIATHAKATWETLRNLTI